MPILTERERIGTKLADKYEITAILGSGGMGTVYVAAHAWTGRRVAVKVLKPSYVENEEVVKRFLREARAAAALHHPNVVDVLDMGRTDDGAVYMVLELLEGDSLGSLLRQHGKMEPARVLPILVPMAEALAEVHDRGFVHRDLKPDNIFVASLRGRTVPKLLDFGIAKALHDPDSSTRTGAIMGTAYYMSPEQASGRSDVGPPTDIWALGVVLYEALAGTPPFTAETATGVLVKILTTPPAPVPDHVPAQIARVVENAMRSDPRERFADMRAMASAMREAAEELRITLPDAVAVEVRTPEEIERASYEPADPRAAAARAATVPSEDRVAPSFLQTIPREAPVRADPRRAPSTPTSPALDLAVAVELPTDTRAPAAASPTTSRATWIVGAIATVVIVVLAYLAFVRSPPAASEPGASTTTSAASTAPPATTAAPPTPTGDPPHGALPPATSVAPPEAVDHGAPESTRDETSERRGEHVRGAATREGRGGHDTSVRSTPEVTTMETSATSTTMREPGDEEPVQVRDEW
jgi:serine/threonine-protein kinase